MACSTGALSMLYAIRSPDPGGRYLVVVSGAALLVMITACLKQAKGRRRMRGEGLL
jgi:hypothetical protein